MRKKIICIIFIVVIIILLFITINLINNKTFFYNTYIGVNNQEIFIPKYSYFNREAGMTVALFYSLKSQKTLENEISNYMNEFEYFENENTYGYTKDNVFIQSYEVKNKGLYRKIYICY